MTKQNRNPLEVAINLFGCLGPQKVFEALQMGGVNYDENEIIKRINNKTERLSGIIEEIKNQNDNELEITINQECPRTTLTITKTSIIQKGDHVTIHKYVNNYLPTGYRVYRIVKNGQEYTI